MSRSLPIRLIALVAGCSIAAFGIARYEAWWTLAFAVGGLAVVMLGDRRTGVRALVTYATATGSILLAAAGLFFFYGTLMPGGRPCPDCSDPRPGFLAAAIGSFVIAAGLLLLARRLVGSATKSRDIPER